MTWIRGDRRETLDMTIPIPSAALNAEAPASRKTFRLLAGCVGATNREADMLRKALIATWADDGGGDELAYQLESLDLVDPEGAEGVESRLAFWFLFADPDDGQLVAEDDPVLAGLSSELRQRLAAVERP